MRNDTKRPRGRPRKFDEAQARAQILATFWENGYASTSLDDLSAATGIGRPSLYSSFGDKERMYLEALRDFARLLADGLRQLSSSPSLREGLQAFYGCALEVYRSGEHGPRGCLVVGTATAEAPRSPAIRGALAYILGQLDEELERFFARFVPASQAGARARLAASVLHSLAIRARAGLPEADLCQLINDAVALLE